jgi:hypothetical protein
MLNRSVSCQIALLAVCAWLGSFRTILLSQPNRQGEFKLSKKINEEEKKKKEGKKQ